MSFDTEILIETLRVVFTKIFDIESDVGSNEILEILSWDICFW
jgi:hypothetical protein